MSGSDLVATLEQLGLGVLVDTNAGLLMPALAVLALLGVVYFSALACMGDAMPRQPRARTKREVLRNADSILDSGGFSMLPWLDSMHDVSGTGAADGWFMALAAIVIYWILGTIVVNVERSGSPFSDDGVFWWRLVSGLWSLGLAFLAFAAVFSLAFVFQSAVVIAGVRPPMAVQIAFQVVLENGMLAAAVWYAYYGDAKDWPWTQKAGLLLEVAVLVLKAHSYLAVNGALSRGSLAGFAASSTALDAMVELEGGAEEADAAARAERSAVEARQRATRDQHDGDSHADDGTSSDSEEEDARQGGSGHNTRSSSTRRRRRRPAAAAAATESPASPVTRRSAAKAAKAADQATASPHDDSSAPRLTQTPSHGADISYPDNVTLADFVRFACAPTVVYSPNFPSTAAFRPLYLLEKVVFAAILLFAALETAIQFVLPVVADLGRAHAAGSPLPAGLVMARMVVPLTALMLLLFFLVFDVLFNAFAEFTLFGDRRFYGDWWNSTSFAEFSRKWNRPVHTWLLHHVYLPLQEAGLGSAVARYGTFAVSIAAHELLLHGFFGFAAPWLLVFSLFQFPLFTIMRLPIFKGKRLGNLVFWFGMALGVPLVGSLYLNDFCKSEPGSCIMTPAAA